jgi:hypothetical protein
LTRGHVDTSAKAAHYVAGHASGGTRLIAANTVDTESAQTLYACCARNANGIQARSEAIAKGATILATCRIGRRERIDRIAHGIATANRTLVVIVGHIGQIRERNLIAHPVALDDFAITGDLASRHDGARSREGKTALICRARARLAEVVGPGAIRGNHASGALTDCITLQIPVAARHVVHIRIGNVGRYARRTCICGANVIVVRQIRIVYLLVRSTHAVANGLFAITRQ